MNHTDNKTLIIISTIIITVIIISTSSSFEYFVASESVALVHGYCSGLSFIRQIFS
jgi:hypothetical protein